ncbi:hypothetical protein L1987_57219 [Smallanthus sonchifolius]|uniref:Uncharacterized protein n=1 Tax=Smallanthus sonchifolius TaxID=185202 RepID=A0ACB9DBZ0_9ASTR|nr:hypothetical protein L1987_57219 [Smallanthus sonchifolius]
MKDRENSEEECMLLHPKIKREAKVIEETIWHEEHQEVTHKLWVNDENDEDIEEEGTEHVQDEAVVEQGNEHMKDEVVDVTQEAMGLNDFVDHQVEDEIFLAQFMDEFGDDHVLIEDQEQQSHDFGDESDKDQDDSDN